MKRMVAVILISLLVAPPASAGQKPGKPITWEEAQQLNAGTEIMLTVKDSPPTKVKLLFADGSILVALKPDAPKLPSRIERPLLSLGSKWRDILSRGGSLTLDDVRVSKDGVFDGDRKVADVAEVIQWAPRGDVVGISEVPHSHLARNILIGVGILVAAAVVALVATGPD
jgi:hypothetical protein